MKKYIEAIEQGEGEDLDFIKEEVESDFKPDKIKKAKDKVKSKEKNGKTYKYYIHTCDHDENKRAGCTRNDI